MSHGTEHNLEESHHAQHARLDPFDRRVALSMAIVAAALAFVTLLSHRAHAESQVKKTDENDLWNYYQAKKQRGYNYESQAELIEAMTNGDPHGKAADLEDKWKKNAKQYAEQAEEKQHEAEHAQHEGHVAHDSSNFFDLGELGIEIALVLCSVALLTKQRMFWVIGLIIGVAGLAVALCGFWAEPIMAKLHEIGVNLV
jgi:hypothetical protein